MLISMLLMLYYTVKASKVTSAFLPKQNYVAFARNYFSFVELRKMYNTIFGLFCFDCFDMAKCLCFVFIYIYISTEKMKTEFRTLKNKIIFDIFILFHAFRIHNDGLILLVYTNIYTGGGAPRPGWGGG